MTFQRSASYQLKDEALVDDADRNRKSVSPLRQVASLWKTWVILLVPIILLPVPLIYSSRAGRCAYAVMIMACYWTTEAMPMAITALLPVVIMPWIGVLGAKDLSVNYLKDTNMLFVGGLIVAVAVEKWNLHKRLALKVLLFVGSKPRWLMFGFMLTTAFLSMWISNTATTAMMIPIAQAVISELDGHRKSAKGSDNPGYDPGDEGVRAARSRDVAPSHGTPDVSDVSMTSKTEKEKLSTHEGEGEPNHNKNVESFHITDSDVVEVEVPGANLTNEDKAFRNICKGLTLCVAYAANIGGTATLTGTGPNLVMKGQVDTLYGGGTGINFSSWFIYSFPNMLITLIFAWFWLQILFLGIRATFGCCCAATQSGLQDRAMAQVIKKEYAKLGPFRTREDEDHGHRQLDDFERHADIKANLLGRVFSIWELLTSWITMRVHPTASAQNFAEVAVLIHFIVLALMWLTREPEFIPGWSYFFPEYSSKFVTDATVAITVAVSLFVFPSRIPNILCFRSSSDETPPGPVPALLDWPTLAMRMPWSVVLVLGGGFALANACQKSGLSDAIGQAFVVFTDIPTWLLVLILCAITAGITEVTSNVAIASIFLPIIAELAEAIEVNPLYLLVPVTVATSFAFMLPVATPPNAIVFAYGNIKIWDMVKAGIVMNIACVLILGGSINTWGYFYFNLGSYPDWANMTTAARHSTEYNHTLARNCSAILGLTS